MLLNKNTSLSNLLSYVIICLFALGPFIGYITRTVLNSEYEYVMVILCILPVPLIFLNDLSFRVPLYLKFLILFAIYTVISDIFIADKTIDIKYFYSNIFIGSVLICIIIENTFISEKFFKFLFIINHIVLFIAFAVSIIQQFGNRLFFVDPVCYAYLSAESYSDTRIPSIYTWVGWIASLGLCFFPILGLTIAHHLKNNYKGLFYLFFIGAVVAFFSKSRYIYVNFMLLFLLIPVYRGLNIGSFFRYVTIFVFFLFSMYYGSKMIGMDTDKIINERILEKNKGGMLKGDAGTRIFAFKVFNKLYFKNPIFGKGFLHAFGPGRSKDYELVRTLMGRSSQIHVGYLSLFYYYGLVGGLIFLLFLYAITRETYIGAKATLQWGPFFAILQYLLVNLTGVILNLFVMGIIISLVYHRYYTQSQT
jgi:hypothetical protein